MPIEFIMIKCIDVLNFLFVCVCVCVVIVVEWRFSFCCFLFCSQDRSVLPLPVKRIVEHSESSSSVSSDEEGECCFAMTPSASCAQR